MGFAKFFLKHGAGTPGAIAKTMARGYRTILAQQPDLSHEQVLQLTLAQRYTLIPAVQPDAQKAFLRSANGNVAQLIVQLVAAENPEGFRAAISDPPLYRTMRGVITEVLEAEMPPGVPRALLR
jgi:hypothetical protein